MLLVFGCQRDDLCPEDTPTTPSLNIDFLDFSNPAIAKNVSNLSIKAQNEDEFLPLGDEGDTIISSTNSILIPLRTDNNTTVYDFIINDNEGNVVNVDQLIFNYNTKEIYINRACGFKVEYENFDAILTQDDNRWISSIDVIEDEIVDESITHVQILF
ncbi:DUF6452 family protein [Gangjinia marincola]|uniref:DUF6452 family protein n=2 Tax=Gangjinia marincola TaxID=578463 RepID=A0ABN1MGE1_9FLAO